MNNLIWLLRASRWARNPPSARRVMLVLAIVALGLGLVALEHFGLWPEWATLDTGRGGPRLPRP
ncbi:MULTISPECIES: hypothetical protein [unclassified Paracoccus (in: a-proteobacteria)]|uniref:hypothetical protein n=1 Tax=unclassified Paracoccus (in: a-proteobacteria) TaxID=2688777 RepID=UPI0012B26B40|nr:MULTISPECIES: hypothetical protein [unclassified Paracoccus (in: a-proteobacteria)]UXU73889.1 hypothetical protein GB879_008100 [Paracoccus sp. SMMA_5]UXU79777.1 hypothetical protein GB880_008080 [Paracoccus sp. SMMA_5_TC]